MFHSAGTGIGDQVPEAGSGGVVGSPVVGMKSQVPFNSARTVPEAGREPGSVPEADASPAAVAAYAGNGSAAIARPAAPTDRILRRVSAGAEDARGSSGRGAGSFTDAPNMGGRNG